MSNATLTTEVRDVLERSTITQNTVTLPRQLERKLYEAVNKVLVNAGGKWNKSSKGHVFSIDPCVKLGLVLKTGVSIDEKKGTQAFFTPEPVARMVMQWAGINPGHSVLEPSAGLGMLALYARNEGGTVDCVEIDPTRYEALMRLDGLGVIVQQDFLKIPSKEWKFYDRIVMNPPFTKGQDYKHVIHALKFLAPGGRLVSIMMPNIKDRTSKEWLSATARRTVKYIAVPAGAFKESGTTIATSLVVIE